MPLYSKFVCQHQTFLGILNALMFTTLIALTWVVYATFSLFWFN